MDEELKKEYKVKGEELLKRIKELIHEGNVRRIIIKDDKGRPYIEIPLTLGLVGAFVAPVLAAIGAMAAMVGVVTVEVIRRD